MAICTFLGHREIYDTGIDDMLQTAVDSVVQENDKTEIFIYHSKNDFYNHCLLTALKARAKHPEKATITLVLSGQDYNWYLSAEKDCLPFCLVDKILPTPAHVEYSKSRNNLDGIKKTQRWIIRQSTHLVSYIYRSLYDAENYIYDYAQRLKSTHIIDATSQETAVALLDNAAYMTEREQSVFEQINDGISVKEIADTMEVSVNRIHQILQHGCRTIRHQLQVRFRRMSANEQRQSVCSVFSIGELTCESLAAVEYITRFVLLNFSITHIGISDNDRHSPIMYALRKCGINESVLCIEADSQEELPYTELIDHADICICNLLRSSYAEKIREYISQTKHCVLIDIGQVCQARESLS